MSEVFSSHAGEWIAAVGQSLFAARNPDGGWPYHAGQASSLEPTALSLLALHGLGAGGKALAAGASWLSARQQPDGFFVDHAGPPVPSWVTPLAGVAMRRLGAEANAQLAATALLSEPVYTIKAISPALYGYDTATPGWPWTYGDYSFTEPTGLALVLLKQLGLRQHARVRQAARMLRGRALAGGGWNYGEPQVLGGDLFPTVLPTSVALVAMADEQDEVTDAGLDWLSGQRGLIPSLFSLGWATIAFNVLGVPDDGWRHEVMTRWNALPPDRHEPMEAALCLLGVMAVEDHPLSL